MKKKILLIISLFSILDAKEDILDEISRNRVWLSLLHYENAKSTILNKEFFISKDGRKNPKEELTATIKKFKQNRLICRYPARYLFLSDKFSFFDKKRLDRCKKVKSWSIVKDTQDISIVFVSGFLGNPASAFGHSFVKINKYNETDGLFDITVSYGAKLPKKYSMISYIFNGLTGGYTASYSDKYFYMDDMVYSNTEYRDMWEYKLKLTEKQKNMILYHLWELQKIHFKYYFFNRNCGYKVSKLLELVSKKPVVDSAYVWYAPVETFYKMDEYNLTNKVVYLPSKQMKIYSFYNSLNHDEKEIVSLMIENSLTTIPKSFKLSDKSKSKIMDFYIEFMKYSKNRVDAKSLQYRINLPKKEYSIKKVKSKPAITKADKMSSLSVAYNRYDRDDAFLLDFKAFDIDKVGYNFLNGDMMSVFGLTALVSKDNIRVYEFDFLKIRRLKVNTIAFDKENPLSWSLKISYENSYQQKDFVINGGVGYSYKLFDKAKLYTLLKTSLHTKEEELRFSPSMGVFLSRGYLKSDIELSKEYDKRFKAIEKSFIKIDMQYRLKSQKSIFLKYENRYKDNLTIGYRWHF